jgi:predicted HTH transcriptional regulator
LTQPRTLEEWDYPAIKRLVVNGFYETDTFEFKPSLKPAFGDPKKRDEFNERILNSVCAFANTYGGFMVFGIEDLKNKSGEDRIVGLGRTDLAVEFGERIKSIDPTIYYNFKNPPVPIPNKDKVIFVAHIPLSSSRPHMVSTTGRFYYRTDGGNKIMDYNEVKREFLTFEERRYKLT